MAGSSPHTRGARRRCRLRRHRRRIIPAYAGSTKPPGRVRRPSRDHPRIRGEHGMRFECDSMPLGSSPHTRGALPRDQAGLFEARIIPAYAGSTPGGFPALWISDGSSPHTRGAREPAPHRDARVRIIPAYAGSTLGNPCNTKDRRRDYTSFPLPVTHPSGGGGS